MRARLRLLLCAPDPRVARAVAGARLRDEAVLQAGRGRPAPARAARAPLPPGTDRPRCQHRSLSAHRAPVSGDARDPRAPEGMLTPGDDRHQVGPRGARRGPPRLDGGGVARQRVDLRHHPERRAVPAHGAARGGAPAAPRDRRAPEPARHPGPGARRPGRSRTHRPRDRTGPPGRPGRGRARRRLRPPPAPARDLGPLPRMARCAVPASRRPGALAHPPDGGRPGLPERVRDPHAGDRPHRRPHREPLPAMPPAAGVRGAAAPRREPVPAARGAPGRLPGAGARDRAAAEAAGQLGLPF